jgi:photosystem II stability/assembly factor-like uncharacterized protein
MYFINQNTGWISLKSNSTNFYLLKTTNGGVNWQIQINSDSEGVQPYKIRFFNDSIGVMAGYYFNGTVVLLKTTNGGTNWNQIHATANTYADLKFVNKDTGWVCGNDGNFGLIWKTTTGGSSFIQQYTTQPMGGNFTNLFFLNKKVNGEYIGWCHNGGRLLRTTNSGINWISIYNASGICGGILDFYFKDSLNGVLVRDGSCLSLTSNGGYNWSQKNIEFGANSHIAMGNDNIGWITKSDTVYKTYNFFTTIGKQPHPVFIPGKIFAFDTSYVWTGYAYFARTTNGGGPVITGINTLNTAIPKQFELKQNYPNPFNPSSSIEFSVFKLSYVTFKIFDILGKEILTVYNNEQLPAGNYKTTIDFSKLNTPAGIYFYKMDIYDNDNNLNSLHSLFSSVKKMMYIK